MSEVGPIGSGDPPAASPPRRLLTVREFVSSLGFRGVAADGTPFDWIDEDGGPRLELLSWPPDIFALASTVLRESGAYLQAVRPNDYTSPGSLAAGFVHHVWTDRCEAAAAQWRKIDPATGNLPGAVVDLLRQIAARAIGGDSSGPLLLHELSRPSSSNQDWVPFLMLMCIADCACRGMGVTYPVSAVPHAPDAEDDTARGPHHNNCLIVAEAARMLRDQITAYSSERGASFNPPTLCKRVDPSRAIVMPKMRTSQRGVTIRSFSLHLSLLNGTDAEPLWIPNSAALLPNNTRKKHLPFKELVTAQQVEECGPYNIILFPWPHEVRPSQFTPSEDHLDCLGCRPPHGHRFFGFEHAPLDPHFQQKIQGLIDNARSKVGHIHGLVMPEMALARKQFDKLFPADQSFALDFITCGVYERPQAATSLGRNYAMILRTSPSDVGKGLLQSFYEQEKHHRWALDAGQIAMYSLGSALSPRFTWWEGIDLPRRSLHFFALDAFTAMSVLICEDLARPDPVADVVRAVGPNLVICLLMDGPQLGTRWSARYATVFADDPGSSVLTLSSLGMVKLGRVRERPHEHSRSIAIWREPGGPPIELHLPDGAHALVISLTAEPAREETIDGRHDSSMAVILRLGGVHPITWDPPAAASGQA